MVVAGTATTDCTGALVGAFVAAGFTRAEALVDALGATACARALAGGLVATGLACAGVLAGAVVAVGLARAGALVGALTAAACAGALAGVLAAAGLACAGVLDGAVVAVGLARAGALVGALVAAACAGALAGAAGLTALRPAAGCAPAFGGVFVVPGAGSARPYQAMQAITARMAGSANRGFAWAVIWEECSCMMAGLYRNRPGDNTTFTGCRAIGW